MCVYKYIHTYRKKYTYRCVCVYTVYVYTYTYMCIYILTHRYIYYLLVHSPNGSNGQGRVRLNILKVTEFYLFFNIIFLIGREIDKMKGRERERVSPAIHFLKHSAFQHSWSQAWEVGSIQVSG